MEGQDKKAIYIPKLKIRVYDNPSTADRYTIIINNDFYAMSDNQAPNGINMCIGSYEDGNCVNSSYGKKVLFKDLPDQVRTAIRNRAYAYIDDHLAID